MWIALAGVSKRASMPALWRLRSQTALRIVFSAFAGKRSKARAVSLHPRPSTSHDDTSCQAMPFSTFGSAGAAHAREARRPAATAPLAVRRKSRRVFRRSADIGRAPAGWCGVRAPPVVTAAGALEELRLAAHDATQPAAD